MLPEGDENNYFKWRHQCQGRQQPTMVFDVPQHDMPIITPELPAAVIKVVQTKGMMQGTVYLPIIISVAIDIL